MALKFIQYFDILSGREEEFTEFARSSYIPGINETGLLQLVGSWYVACGEGPYFIFEGMAETLRDLNRLLEMQDFHQLTRLLHFLITNYKTKVLLPTGLTGSQLPVGRHFRFNQHFNLVGDRREEYEKFVRQVQIPTMTGLGLEIVGGWWVAIGPGPGLVVEGAGPSVEDILRAVGRPEYRRMLNHLFRIGGQFGSKILVPTGLIG